ncbi:hypothetical protein VTK73DRAFT_8813 [Phialemonium thermophilum]|uniref:SGNH hydrolase-type esterase domain-containing protein n=1 Tax=Phialemonium thermophilum TaxID=223376 RepID=A0ABR3W6H4_9PEZI
MASLNGTRLRILCFGDSLTAGYSCYGAVYHPYEEKLDQMVAMAFPEYTVQTVEDGKPGAMVCVERDFLGRMQRHFGPSSQPFDWAIVLGGTNDIAIGVEAETIYESLKKVWSVALTHGTRVLALTVPDVAMQPSPRTARVDATRKKLNDLIKGHKQENFHAYDLQAAIPYASFSDAERNLYWDDAVHFTPDGYDLIGRKVGMALVSLLVRERTQSETPARRQRVYRDDDRVFDEEGGDPNAIDQGYIVVRRKDLD